MGGEVLLAGVEHAIDPGQQFLGRMVGVEDDPGAVVLGQVADVVGAGDRPED